MESTCFRNVACSLEDGHRGTCNAQRQGGQCQVGTKLFQPMRGRPGNCRPTATVSGTRYYLPCSICGVIKASSRFAAVSVAKGEDVSSCLKQPGVRNAPHDRLVQIGSLQDSHHANTSDC
jgi:hypothetical protein